MTQKISFKDDYSHAGHPRLIDAIAKISHEQNATYCLDQYCLKAQDLIREQTNTNCDVHFIAGGTLANIVTLGHMLRPYESVISCDTGHINVHETGALEGVGHKINTVPHTNGKLSIDQIETVLKKHHFEHMVSPKVVYISQSTELGSIYSKDEIKALYAFCQKNNLYFFIDGARLAASLACDDNDCTLQDLVQNSDALYIGGTKNGAIMGEAIVLNNDTLKPYFRYQMKHLGPLAAKGMVIGVQFVEFFKDGLYEELAKHAFDQAQKLVAHLKDAGADFAAKPQTNMIFPILPKDKVEKLEEHFNFYRWAENDDDITLRLITSWATKEEDVEKFGQILKS